MFAEVTAEDHPDKVRESEAGESLVHRLVSALHSIFITTPSTREKPTITRPIKHNCQKEPLQDQLITVYQ